MDVEKITTTGALRATYPATVGGEVGEKAISLKKEQSFEAKETQVVQPAAEETPPALPPEAEKLSIQV